MKFPAPSRLRIACLTVFVTVIVLLQSGCSGGWGAHAPSASIKEGSSQTATAGQPITFTATTSGVGPFTYQWFVNGVAINGATSSSYTTPTDTSMNGYVFTVVVTNAGGSTSQSTTLKVNGITPSLAFSSIAAKTYGDPAFTVEAGSASAGVVTYSVVSGPATVSGNKVTLTGAGTVVLKASQTATNLYTAVTTTTSVTVNPATPNLSFSPVSTRTLGDAPFSISATSVSSGTVTYSVVSGPASISGNIVTPTGVGSVTLKATQAATANYNAATASTTFAVVDSTPIAGSIIGSSATPAYGATITVTPVFSGGTAVIGTSGVGSSDVTSSAKSGQSYTTAAVRSTTVYTLTVTSQGGGATASSTFTATPASVNLTAILPSAQTAAPGNISFSTTATGGATNTVTWQASAGSINGSGVWTSPNTEGTYTITATSVDDPSVSVSKTITLSKPVIRTQPVSKNVCSGYPASLSIGADYADSYTWTKGGVAVGSSAVLSWTSVDSSANGSYVATVSNGAGSLVSNTAVLNVLNPTVLTITSNPAAVTVYATQTATFAVSASGSGKLSYQWYKDGTAIPGATFSTYTTGALAAADGGAKYSATVTDADCTNSTVTSSSATLTVSTVNTAVPPTIVVQPSGENSTVGGRPTFAVTAAGSGTLRYQWYRVPYNNSMATTAGVEVVGATSANFTLPSSSTAQGNDGDQYYVVVSNDYGSAVSQRAILGVGAGVVMQLTGQPSSQYVPVGSLASLTTTATCTGCTPAYQWYWYAPGSTVAVALSDGTISSGALSGATVSGAKTGTVSLSGVPSTASGSVLYAVVSSTSDGLNQISGTNPLTTNTAGLFVGSLGSIGNPSPEMGLCNDATNSVNWVLNGTNPGTFPGRVPYQNTAGCSIQLTNDGNSQQATVYWPTLISTAKFTLSFTVALSHSGGTLPADGFTLLLADPSQGATTSTIGGVGWGIGAANIPGLVLAFDTFQNDNLNNGPLSSCASSWGNPNRACDPTAVPYMAIGQGATNLWENPWTNVNGYLDTQHSANYSISTFANSTHDYVVSVLNGTMTVTMDGFELFTGKVSLPPVAYLGLTAGTGGNAESVTFSKMTATVSAP